MKYCRINLEKTNYQLHSGVLLQYPPVPKLKEIFKKYALYRNLDGIMPIFDSQFTDVNNDVFCYYYNGDIVAFSLCRRHDSTNVESVQFAWDYEEPRLRLGIKSLEHECAFYKLNGYKFLYLGPTEQYKTNMDGFEELTYDDL